MNKRKIRDMLRLTGSVLMGWLYIPHLIVASVKNREMIFSDVNRLAEKVNVKLPRYMLLLYLLHTNRYYRTVFYYRIGPVAALLISWLRPKDRYFQISYETRIGEGLMILHPYATVLNAESIGRNFTCLHCTTLGATAKGRPVIGDNVSLGANVNIIGNVHIGDNVTIGAGSVVVKDLPSNCVAVGNPARVVKSL